MGTSYSLLHKGFNYVQISSTHKCASMKEKCPASNERNRKHSGLRANGKTTISAHSANANGKERSAPAIARTHFDLIPADGASFSIFKFIQLSVFGVHWVSGTPIDPNNVNMVV